MALIRPYRPADRAEVRKIFQDTAFHGESYRGFFDDGEWLADFMTEVYLSGDPRDVFVAEDAGRVIGYLMGTADSARLRRRWLQRVLPLIVTRFFSHGIWCSRRAWRFFTSGFLSQMKREEAYPAGLSRAYPAHFHINVDSAYRGKGVGRELGETYLDALRVRGVRGVHVRTASRERRQGFFESLGFQPLLIKELTLWNYLQQPPYYLITYGLSLAK